METLSIEQIQAEIKLLNENTHIIEEEHKELAKVEIEQKENVEIITRRQSKDTQVYH